MYVVEFLCFLLENLTSQVIKSGFSFFIWSYSSGSVSGNFKSGHLRLRSKDWVYFPSRWICEYVLLSIFLLFPRCLQGNVLQRESWTAAVEAICFFSGPATGKCILFYFFMTLHEGLFYEHASEPCWICRKTKTERWGCSSMRSLRVWTTCE